MYISKPFASASNPRRRAAALAATLLALGCAKEGESEPANQPASAYPATTAQPVATTAQNTYPQSTYPQSTYPQSTYPAATTTATPATTATTGLSTPAEIATPCQDDSPCLTHRCNTAYGRCAWPCTSDNDCLPGNQCIGPVCVPTTMGGTQ